MATDVHVGGRLEAVAPRRVTDPGDRVRLLGLLAVAAAVHGWMVFNTGVPARDAIEFSRVALQIESPRASGLADLVAVLKQSKQPPGYPLAVMAVSWPVRAVSSAPLPDEMLLAAQLASSIAGVLLVVPTYWLGRGLFGKPAGVAAAVLVQVLPVFAQVTSDGLTEGLYLLMVATALVLGVRAVRKPGVGGFLLCGMAAGGAYLVRPEGLATAAAVGAVVAWLGLRGVWPRGPAAGRLTALAVGVLLLAAPYMLLIGGVTNKPSGDILPKLNHSVRELIAEGPAVPGAPLFAAWWDRDRDGPLAVWVPVAVAKESMKAFHYMPAALAALGVWAVGRRFRHDPAVWVPAVFAGLMLVVLATLAAVGQTNPAGKYHYVSERHTLPVVFVGCVFAAGGLEWVGRRVGSPARLGVLAVVVVSCLGPLAKPLHASKVGHVAAGRFLADAGQPNRPVPGRDTLIDPFELAQYHAGWTVRSIPADPATPAAIYAVVEPNGRDDAPHSALPRRADALKVQADGRSVVVFRWPEGAADAHVKVAVVRLDPAAK